MTSIVASPAGAQPGPARGVSLRQVLEEALT
jgi:hypothetical protein